MMRKKQYSRSKLLKIVLLINLAIFAFLLSSVFKLSANSSKTPAIEAKRIADECFNKNKEKCYENEFVQLTKDMDISFAEQTLYAIQDYDPLTRHCHVLSHEISKTATRKDPSRWKELMQKVNIQTCGAGFLHGILEAHAGDDPNFMITPKFVDETCIEGAINFKAYTCSHILGHLIIVDKEGKIDPALDLCSKINPELTKECYTGVFMEDSFKLDLVEHGFAQIPVRDEARMVRQTDRCLKYDGLKSVGCWIDLAEIYAELYNYDSQKVYDSCYKAPLEAARKDCYLKGVILMAVSPDYETSKQFLSECNFYTNDREMYKKCTDFIISSLMHYSPKFASRGVTLCSNIDDEYKTFCFQDLGRQLKVNVLSRTDRNSYCSGAPDMYKNFCVD